MTKHIIISDLDDTLSDATRRAALLPDWDAFHAASIGDERHWDTIQLLRALDMGGYEIAIVTGRNEKFRGITIKWLVANEVPHHYLLMRDDGDYRRSDVVKVEMVRKSFEINDILLVLEDDECCVDAYRNLGIECHHVRPRTI